MALPLAPVPDYSSLSYLPAASLAKEDPMLRRYAPALALPLAVLAAACGDTTAPPSPGGLTPAESREVAYQMDGMSMGALGTGGGMMGSALPSGEASLSVAAPDEFSRSFDRTVPCPQGGTKHMAGKMTASVDRTAGTHSFRSEVTSTPSQCGFVVRAESPYSHVAAAGTTIKITGAPSLVMEHTTSSSHAQGGSGPASRKSSSTQKGAFSFTTGDGRSGTCAVDTKSTVDFAARSYRIQGTFCGKAIDETRTLTHGWGGRPG